MNMLLLTVFALCLGTAASAQGQMSVKARDGSSIPVKDFLHDGVTVHDKYNPNLPWFRLADSAAQCGGPPTLPCQGARTQGFNIMYDGGNSGFMVSLTTRKLARDRAAAESFLQKKLRISKTDMCRLNVQVMTTMYVDRQLGGKDLGLSFCPGATPLTH